MGDDRRDGPPFDDGGLPNEEGKEECEPNGQKPLPYDPLYQAFLDYEFEDYALGSGKPQKAFASSYPVFAKRTSGLMANVEPLVTPKLLKSRYLFGMNLTAPNGDKMDDDTLKDYITTAVTNAELELKLPIDPKRYHERQGFDREQYRSYIFTKVKNGPVLSVEAFEIQASNGLVIFKIPSEWVDPGGFSRRQLNVIPYLATQEGGTVVSEASGGAGAFFLASLGNSKWLPAYWSITYTAGLADKKGQIPKPVNDLIGVMVALKVFEMLGPLYIFNSTSLSQDGISQSSSTQGTARFAQRVEELKEQKTVLIAKIRSEFSSKFIVGSM